MGLIRSLSRTTGRSIVRVCRDRLARDVILSAMIERLAERKGSVIVAADGTGNGHSPEAQLMRRMVDAFGEYERELIRARTKAALAVKKRNGRRVGQVPFGYRLSSDGVKLVKHSGEQRTIKQIEALRESGLSIRAITETLEQEGYRPRGARWHPTTVARLLERLEAGN